MPVTFLRKATAQSLVHHLSMPIDSGNTPTCTLYDESGTELQASTSVTKGPRTTLDGDAVADQTTVPLTATTDIVVGEEYGIGPNAAGQSEVVIVDSISSGVSVVVRHDLLHTYASANVFASRKCSLSVLAASIPNAEKNCRARWIYQSNSQEYAEESVFHISTYAPVCTVTEADILRRIPDARNLTIPGQPLSEVIEDIWAEEVLGDLAVIWTPTATISGDSLRLATIHRVCSQLAMWNEKFEAFDRWMAAYQADLERAVATMPKDIDDDGASDDELVYHPGSFRVLRS